jgi:hypothetical protein
MSVSMNFLFYDLQNAAYSIKDSAPVQTPKKCGARWRPVSKMSWTDFASHQRREF